MTERLANPTPFEAALETKFKSQSGKSQIGDDAMRAHAFARFAAARLPHRRIEGWRWSDFNAALRNADGAPAPQHASAPPLAADLAGLKPLELRIVNGRIDLPEGEAPAGVRFGVIDAAATMPALEPHPIASLNAAMTDKALELEVVDGADVGQPLIIRHFNTGAGFCFAQTLVRLSAGAKATIIETYEGDGAGFYSHLGHVVIEDGAALTRAVLQDVGDAAIIQSICTATLEGASHFSQTALSTGARLSRHETLAQILAAGASVKLDSASLLAGNRHQDFTSEVVFIGEGGEARQRHKGVARNHGRNVFQGKFKVTRSAQKTDAQMNAAALLLSDAAEANHKPELEIYADDVQCAHGSTAGALDENAIFYMRQRGLDDAAARALLIEAFVAEAFDTIAHPGLHQAFAARVAGWLEAK
ncbi:MAG: Fe-S cluster assembly protein SufD [Parvularculaceae bacterium]|nr:Fe-S cluster assembly protein SufD [Parvularculaceae bacterium]